MKHVKRLTGPYYSIIVFFFLALSFLSTTRFIFLLIYHSRVPTMSDGFRVLVNGLRIDTVMAVYCSSLPVLLAPFMEGYKYTDRFFRTFVRVWFTVWASFIAVMEVITPAYIDAYDVRPNRLFVEYLVYPNELVSMLLKGYLFPVILGVIVLAFSAFGAYRLSRALTLEPSTWHPASKLAVLPLLALLLFLGGRSSLGHRPINPSTVAFSNVPLLNDLALNSSYSLVYAIYRMKDEGNAARVYGNMDNQHMLNLVRQSMGIPSEAFTVSNGTTWHMQAPGINRKAPLNLVIILEESLGAEFVGSLGGLPLTPHLEKLSSQGLWFDNLYATGTRSVRGIEAVISGFPPTPGRSVVKLGKSQKKFFTLASILSRHGYDTRFIYGGDSNFDNMKKFFLNNGFNRVIDKNDFENPSFKGSWGVSDQDLFSKALDIMDTDENRPSFTLIFSSSNHPPYEFPDQVINLYEQPRQTIHNAVKYADYALGEFFDSAGKKPWWDKTLFLVVADHNSHTGGESFMPIDRFRIPGLIIGPGVAPGVHSAVASQIDLPPTLLSLMGISSLSPMIGHDLTQPRYKHEGRAILQFYTTQAYMIDDDVTLLQPEGRIDHFKYKGQQLVPANSDDRQADIALAHALWASWAYKHMEYSTDRGPIVASHIP